MSVVRGSRTPEPELIVYCLHVLSCDTDRKIFDVKTAPDCCLGNGLSYGIPGIEDTVQCVNCVGKVYQ